MNHLKSAGHRLSAFGGIPQEKLDTYFIFANDVSKKNIGFNSDYNKVTMIDKIGNIKHFPKNKKSFIANKIAQILLDKLLNDRNFN